MRRLYLRTTRRIYPRHRLCHIFRSFASSSAPLPPSKHPVDLKNSPRNSHSVHSPPPPLPAAERTDLSCVSSSTATGASSSFFTRNSVVTLSLASASAMVASAALLTSGADEASGPNPNRPRASLEHAIQRWNESFNRVAHHVKQTGVAASVLWQSLRSLLSSANHEVRAGFELRVAALLADIAAASAARRAALVGAGHGAVVDWLLETVATPGDGNGTQDEAARALAYLIADPNVSQDALGRPHAVPSLLRFIFSCQPKTKHPRRTSFDVSDSLKGRSMLVAAIMDIVTANCDSAEKLSFRLTLPSNAEMRDIAAAIQVIEEGGMHLDEPNKNEEDDNGGTGMRGIGIKILGGTTVLGLSRTGGHMELGSRDNNSVEKTPRMLALLNKHDSSQSHGNLSSAVIPGLWDDLHCQHVAVPFAAWALANWAMASSTNRSHIQELDRDGYAVMMALVAPERSVKWHGSLVARLLLEDRNLPLNDSVSDWSSSLLATISHASKNEDISLAQVALSAFLLSVDRSQNAQKVVMERGLPLMRDIAQRTKKHKQVQETLAKALELLSTGDLHLSLEEGQKWSCTLLAWVLGKMSSDAIQSSAIRILSCILEDYGPSSIPISQGWLALILNEILNSSKPSPVKANNQQKKENLKAPMDTSKALYGTQARNQLVGAVVNLAAAQLGTTVDSIDSFPLLDLLSLEPFAGQLKKLERDNPPKIDAADSALATLKAIKALTEVCLEDPSSQSKIVDFGILCLLRRFLLCDDYEKLAATEAYDACGARESQEQALENTVESSPARDPSSVRVPATSHIRRHAARLLNFISILPKVQEVVIADTEWCQWLEDCARGKTQGCSDLKIQSYARAALLNIFCNQQTKSNSEKKSSPGTDTSPKNQMCPQYSDMIFLINPGLPHWKCRENLEETVAETDSVISNDRTGDKSSDVSNLPGTGHASKRVSYSKSPEFDVVFVHGLRGGPYKTWRITEDKSSTKSGLVEKIDQEAGKFGTFWPGDWLSDDFPQARLFTLKYKTNLTQWSGATLPLQEVSSMLLGKLVAAGIGNRPVVFVTHSMGGLLVKQILYKAKAEKIDNLVNNTVGVVFYSCPHFGSKLADVPWRMGLVLRPAPSIGELRSGSSRLIELNDFMRHLHKKGKLDVLSFCETKVTPIVEGYGGWALRMEIVPIESAYPGFGELVVLESTDHINSCKPVSRSDPSYKETLEFLWKLRKQQRRL